MTRFARLFATGSLVLAASAAAAGVPQVIEGSDFPAYKLLRPDLAGAGQPTAAGLARLKALGFRAVINLRTEKEGAADERAVVEGQGLRYVNVPITAESFSLADVQAVQRVLDDPAAAPVLLHCASANRVGAVWAVIQARGGQSLEQAEAAGQAAGLHSPAMIDAVRRVLAAPPATAPKP